MACYNRCWLVRWLGTQRVHAFAPSSRRCRVAPSSACVALEQLYETSRAALNEFTELRRVTLQRILRQFPIYEECNDADLSQ
jgi:hypothetical protein